MQGKSTPLQVKEPYGNLDMVTCRLSSCKVHLSIILERGSGSIKGKKERVSLFRKPRRQVLSCRGVIMIGNVTITEHIRVHDTKRKRQSTTDKPNMKAAIGETPTMWLYVMRIVISLCFSSL